MPLNQIIKPVSLFVNIFVIQGENYLANTIEKSRDKSF